jgi:hypothetical protein
MLSLDVKYLMALLQPVAPWGTMKPHKYVVYVWTYLSFADYISCSSVTGIFSIVHTIHRSLPTATDNITHETIHASVMEQMPINPTLGDLLLNHPEIVSSLSPLEVQIKMNWPFEPQPASVDDALSTAAKLSTTSKINRSEVCMAADSRVDQGALVCVA